MKKIILNVVGVIFALTGISEMFSGEILSGMAFVLLGLSFLPIFYEKTKLDKYKKIRIILPIILFIFLAIIMPADTINTNLESNINDTTNSNILVAETIEDKENIEELVEDSIISDSTQMVEYKNEEIVVEKEEIKDNSGKTNNSNNKTQQKTVKQEISSSKIEETSIKKETSNNENNNQETIPTVSPIVEETPKTEISNNSENVNQNEEIENANNQSNNTGIYRTPHGERYHYDKDCGGKNSYSITFDEAISAALTPCKKCVQ